MADFSNNDHSILNLSPEEKRVFSYLFNQADKDQLGVVTGENAVTFFERTKLSPNVLGEIWQIADTENRGLLTLPGFCMVLRLIGHYQAGKEPTTELAFQPGPIPKFDGMQIPGVSGTGSGIPSPTGAAFPQSALQPQLSGQAPIRVPPLDPQKAQQYANLFERSGTQSGQLDGATAKAIFERAGLPNEILGRIWSLTDRNQKGFLDQSEFIVAMHLLTSIKSKAMAAIPNTLPPGLYEAASRRGAPPSRQGSMPGVIPRQTTGSSFSAVPRTQSPLARAPGYGTPPVQSAQTTGTSWLVTPMDKSKFDQFFNTIDTQGRGVISGEQAVSFFSDSRLPEETLAQIWDLADINSEGQLNKDEFAVAMYLIRQQRAPNPQPLPAFLPSALIPPSMRKQSQQTQSTAPAFDNANNTSGLSKSAADDLFGLDQPSSPLRQQPATAVLQPQVTGASASRDPFGGSQPGSPASPQRFQPTPQQPTTMFKPFIPTSNFGTSLATQNTGGSATGAVASRNVSQSLPQQPPSAMDDLLGDNESHTQESSKLTNETTELANMSNQIGNLRTQMEQTQAKKTTTQADLNATNAQKRDLEVRLQQFRAQYEQEVKTVKEVEQQLTASRDATKKLNQELAMLEGTYHDLQTQHQTVSQALQADQQENATLKQRISQINAEVAQLKPGIEKLKLDARQQKGLVSINKKQLATNEAERDRLQTEKTKLERDASEREEHERIAAASAAAAATTAAVAVPTTERVASPAPSNLASPAASANSTNPFMRKPSSDGPVDRSMPSPPATEFGASPTPSAFDALFGPSSAFSPSGQASSRAGTPPATSFIGRSIPQTTVLAVSDSMQPTPSATPPPANTVTQPPHASEPPPPPPVSRQFSASHLPVVDIEQKPRDSESSSTRVVPPASRTGPIESPITETSTLAGSSALHIPGSFDEVPSSTPPAGSAAAPGAFPPQQGNQDASSDFDSAFAGFGDHAKSKDASGDDPFAPQPGQAQPGRFHSEFPPIENLEPEDDDDDDSEDEQGRGFEDSFNTSSFPSPPAHQSTASAANPLNNVRAPPIERSGSELPSVSAQKSPPTYEESNEPSHGGSGKRSGSNQFPPEFGGLLPSREDPTSPPLSSIQPSGSFQTSEHDQVSNAASSDVFHDAPSQQATTAKPSNAQPASKNTFDDFDDFADLSESREADHAGSSDVDYGFGGRSVDEFNPAFDSPAASMTNTMASSQQTPVVAARSLHQNEGGNGFGNFQPSMTASSTFGSVAGTNSIQQTPKDAQHDWDAIFSGLDNSNLDTSFSGSGDPWTNGAERTPTATTLQPAAANPTMPALGRAITPGTEHDDPILKRLTGMGYPRQQALTALEMYDYDINKAVDHLSSS